MATSYKDTAIQRIIEMPKEQVSKVLIFMAGMEAQCVIALRVQKAASRLLWRQAEKNSLPV